MCAPVHYWRKLLPCCLVLFLICNLTIHLLLRGLPPGPYTLLVPPVPAILKWPNICQLVPTSPPLYLFEWLFNFSIYQSYLEGLFKYTDLNPTSRTSDCAELKYVSVFLCLGMQAKWYQRGQGCTYSLLEAKTFNNEEFALFVYSQKVTCFLLVCTDAL